MPGATAGHVWLKIAAVALAVVAYATLIVYKTILWRPC